MKRTIPDVPSENLDFVIASLNVDNPISITKEKQDNGLWTVIAEFPDEKASPGTESGKSSSTEPSQAGALDSSVETLARTLWGEARGETKAGREAIASVVLNRLKKPQQFGGTIEEVCLKPFQFSCWNANDPNLPKLKAVDSNDPVFAECLSIAENAAKSTLSDPTNGADHYHAKGIIPPWARDKSPCAVIGNHLFYNNIA